MSKLIDKYNNDEVISYDTYENDFLYNLKFNLESIEEVDFIKCKFENVSFRDLYLGKTTFINCEFTNCYFINVNLNYITFKDCKLTDVVFENGKATFLNVIDSVVQYCNFSLKSITKGVFTSKFTSCSYHYISLMGCDFATSEFNDLELDNLICNDVHFNNCKISNIIGDINNLKGATISMDQALNFILAMGIEIKEL